MSIRIDGSRSRDNTVSYLFLLYIHLPGPCWLHNTRSNYSATLQGLKIIDLQQTNYLSVLERSVTFGHPVLLQNVQEALDASLNPILTKSVIKQGTSIRRWETNYVCMGSKVWWSARRLALAGLWFLFIHVGAVMHCTHNQGCGAVTFLVGSGSGEAFRLRLRLRLRVKLFGGSGSGSGSMIKSTYEP